jgi:hypothetical protein
MIVKKVKKVSSEMKATTKKRKDIVRSTPKSTHLSADIVRSSPKTTHPGKIWPGKNLGKHLQAPAKLPTGAKIGVLKSRKSKQLKGC